MPYHDNGPRAGRGRGRNRNSVVNNASKAPVVSPGSAVNYGAQTANLQLVLAQRLAAMKAQAGLIRSDFLTAKAGARAEAVSGMASQVNTALDRGILGSSTDLAGRASVDAARAAAGAAAIRERTLGKLGLQQERISAFNEFYSGLFDVQSTKAAEQAEMANQQFLQDAVLRMNDEQSARADAILSLLRGGVKDTGQPVPNRDKPLGPEPSPAGPAGPTSAQRGVAGALGAFKFLPENVKRVIRQLIAAGILPGFFDEQALTGRASAGTES